MSGFNPNDKVVFVHDDQDVAGECGGREYELGSTTCVMLTEFTAACLGQGHHLLHNVRVLRSHVLPLADVRLKLIK